jgi:tRNA pseudouridine38-40 synthase
VAKPRFTKHFYLARLQFLGFRYHGWQKQVTGHKTIQEMLDRTLRFIVGENNSKTLGASRTDAMVSAEDFVCKITTKVPMDAIDLLAALNLNLPQDIRVLELVQTVDDRNIIDESKTKTYRYYFCNEQKANPMISPYMTNFKDDLDFDLMMQAAKIFEGDHDFKRFCYRPTPDKTFKRNVEYSNLSINEDLTASFFPKKSYVFEVKSEGFMRHQIRIMMGALILVGSKKLSIDELKESLLGESFERIPLIASASGLKLYKTDFTF